MCIVNIIFCESKCFSVNVQLGTIEKKIRHFLYRALTLNQCSAQSIILFTHHTSSLLGSVPFGSTVAQGSVMELNTCAHHNSYQSRSRAW